MPRQSQTQSTSNRKPEQRVEVKIKGQILYCSTHLKQSTYSTYNTPMISTSRYSLRKITMKICFSSRLRLQAATPTARCCGSSDHLLFFSRWLKPGILLRGGCKYRANQAVGNGLFWIANEAKLQRWSQTKNRGNRKNCFPSTAFKNLSSVRLQPLQPRENPIRFSLSVKPTARRRQSGDHLPSGGAPPSPLNPLLPTRAYGCCDARTCYCVPK